MDLRYYQEFIELSQQLNYRKAAAELCMSQSALSKHIKALEDHYGCALLARTRQSVSLTPEGAELLEYAQALWRDYEASVTAIRRMQESRPLVVAGLLESPEEHAAVADLMYFMGEQPGLRRVRIRNVGSVMPTQRLKGLPSRLFDCYVFYGLENEVRQLDERDEIEIAPICTVPLGIVVSADSVLAEKERVSLSELAGGTFIHLSGPNFTPTWRLVEAILHRKGVPFVEKPVPTDSVYDYANPDLGNAILVMPLRPHSPAFSAGPRTKIIPVSDDDFALELDAAFRKAERDESIERLIEGLRQCYDTSRNQ